MSAVTQASPRVECSYCGHVLSHGVAPVSHGICDDPACHRLAERTITPVTIEGLYTRSEIVWGRFRNGECSIAEWERVRTRADTALELFEKDLHTEIRRLRVAAAETEAAHPLTPLESGP